MSESAVRQFLRSSGVMAGLYAGSTGLSFATGVVLAHLLGPKGYGTYALALTTATIIGLVTEFGLPVLAMRETGFARASGEWGELRGLLHWADRAIGGLSLILVAGTIGAIVASGKAGDSAYLSTMLWAVALVPLVAFGKLRSVVLMALDHVASSQATVMILRPLVFLLLSLALWAAYGSLSPAQAMAAQSIGAATALIVVAILFRRFRPEGLMASQPEFAVRDWLSACLPMGLTEGLRLLQGQIALLIVGALAGTAQAGLYRVADGMLQIASVVASVVATAATPLFGRMAKGGDERGIERVAILAAAVMAGGAIVLGAPIALAGTWVVPAIFGHDFAPSAPVFSILWIGLCASYAMGLSQSVANMTGHHVLTAESFIVVAVVNLALGFALVPHYGAEGAAISTSISITTGSVWCAIRLYRRTGFNTTLINPALSVVYREAVATVSRKLKSKG